ncbi:hypothetical protein C6T59_18730 [Burkholderia multivorans]|uniref:hypothetical protein n=1 Tax=Burkholderia multivorans TaxID=87883 RepID=UPI000CFE35F2|nr:hypothetical protein [Burkholderia multivorans]MBU9514478.1 hypothetical protein [Burkholderia multivorans]MDN8009198.1 hypothetical protein [Burkholderia multivorans]PRE96286.1 hypothetical protein C6Q01_29075 [Burkholderia multivorans]PRG64325.1 hypothetical protein C6T59_18730 [Burkholderia multivorans]
MDIFITNLTPHAIEFKYRLSGVSALQVRPIPRAGTIKLSHESEVIKSIIDQHAIYGMMDVTEALSRGIPASKLHLVYQEGKPISATQLYDLVHGRMKKRDEEAIAIAERGFEAVEEGAEDNSQEREFTLTREAASITETDGDVPRDVISPKQVLNKRSK